MSRTPRQAAVDRLAVAWERWDTECLRRTPAGWVPSHEPGARGPRPVNLPGERTNRRMEDACREMAGLLSLTTTAFRTLLMDSMKDGASYRGAIQEALAALDAERLGG